MTAGIPLVRQLWDKFGMQAVKFCTIGGSALLLSSVLLYALTEYGHLWYVYSNWIAVVLGQVSRFAVTSIGLSQLEKVKPLTRPGDRFASIGLCGEAA